MRVRLYSFILLLNSFATGLLVPVLSLLLIQKGATLSMLSILIGIYSFSVIILEFPTGIMTDIMGRKKTFCLSLIVSLMFSIVVLLGNGMVILYIGMLLYGLNRAISSGSFEALFIDSYINEFGKDKLHDVTIRINVMDALGLSAGALAGGYLPKISDKYFSSIGMYDLSLIVRIILTFIVLIFAMIYIKETVVNENKKRVFIWEHIKISSNLVANNKNVICIFISVFSTGFLFSSLETYWQPHFISLMPDNSAMFLLGVMAFMYFAAAMTGNIIYGRIFSKHNTKKMYLLLRSILVTVLIITALQTNMVLFMFFYTLIYLFLGMSNIPEGVILNGEIPNEHRASILSLNSLVLQMGVLFGSFFNSIMINYSSIPGLWFAASVVIVTTILIIYKKLV
ncbi:MFS transporter [Sedimentibacter hydroxybenzoicus DSM 7310]|uniref:MFS transporter n=1 Tax=Sedimentibacter hydroxybenzoicus DSM 7310 TaxID=1123245 RepID=A0A974GW21_SEDHY|nr:MFS transporter [Sedimentibacter hydroxybenzoicus]NYB73615.1 MFS transporter [Sedimentibacter hydroxybenzoicus DSM 7310]